MVCRSLKQAKSYFWIVFSDLLGTKIVKSRHYLLKHFFEYDLILIQLVGHIIIMRRDSGHIVLAIMFMIFGIFQLAAGWAGIEEQFGTFWGIVAIVCAFLFQFTLPIVVGCFLCAVNIWDWHWFGAVLFAAPGLLVMIPAFVAGVFKS